MSRNQNFPCCWRSLFGLPSFQSILKFRCDCFCHSHERAPHSTHLCASSSGFKAWLCFGSVRCSALCCFAFCAAVCNVLFLLRFHLIVKHTVVIALVIHVRSPHVHCPHVRSPCSARYCVSSCGIFSFQRAGLSAVLCFATHCSTCWDVCALSTCVLSTLH